MKYRVIEINNRFYVQKNTGFLFTCWEYINIYGLPVDYNHDPEDASKIHFKEKDDAIMYMEGIAYPKEKPALKVWAWIN